MPRPPCTARILAGTLAIALGAPGPVFALRQRSPERGTPARSGLEETLNEEPTATSRIPGRPRRYASSQAVRAELARRTQANLPNNPGALQQPLANGGDYTLYLAAREFQVELPEAPVKYPDADAVRAELARRTQANLPNNPGALVQPLANGGDQALYLAAREFGVRLPIRRRRRSFVQQSGMEELSARAQALGREVLAAGSSAGLENATVTRYDGLVAEDGTVAPDKEIRAGLEQPGERRLVVWGSVAIGGALLVFRHPDLPSLEILGTREVLLDLDPKMAHAIIRQLDPQGVGLILLPGHVAPEDWRPHDGSGLRPTLMFKGNAVPTERETLAALVRMALEQRDHILRVELEEAVAAELGGDYALSVQY